jgi:short-subunit dehydrogenase
VVVISGASSGIGEEIALKYAKKHSKLILGARRVEKLAEVAERCVSNGASSADVIRCDVSQENDCKSLIAKSMELHGRIDVLVLNAGVGQVNTHTHCLPICFSLCVCFYLSVSLSLLLSLVRPPLPPSRLSL